MFEISISKRYMFENSRKPRSFAMRTRSKAAGKVVLGPKNPELGDKDSGILCADDTQSSSASQTQTLKNRNRKNSKKKPGQPTASSIQKNVSDVDKANDGSLPNSQRIDSQGSETSFEKTQTAKKSSKRNVLSRRGNNNNIQGQPAAEEEMKLSQHATDCDWKDIIKWLQSRRDVGLWIQCCRENCRKWRFSDEIHDPVDVPEIWYCDMQLDSRVAYCDYPQQEIPPHVLEDLIENKYNAGSIVWAQLSGYPWWPAMVDDCPYTFRYYELGKASKTPIKYSVTYFTEERVQCSWIPVRNLRPYKGNPKEVFLKRKRMTYRGISFKDQVLQACVIADEAQQLPLCERLQRFSFAARFTDNVPTQTAERNTGSQNRTCPVMLKTSGAMQKELCGDNLTIPKETTDQQTASTSRSYSQNNVQNQKVTEKASKVSKNKKRRRVDPIFSAKPSTHQNASSSEKNLQTTPEIPKEMQGFSQVTSNNAGSRRSILNATTARRTASTLRKHSRTNVESQKETETLSKVALNINGIEVIFHDQTSTHENASDFAKYAQTSVGSRKVIQGFHQVASDVTRSESKGDEASDERNSREIYPQTSFESQNDNERPSVVASQNTSSSLENSLIIERGIEILREMLSNKESSCIEKFPCDNKSSDQHGASTSTTYSPTSVETQWEIEGAPRIITNNQSSKNDEQKESLRTEKGDEGKIQCYPHLDLTLERFKARQLLRAQARESQQNSFKGEKIIQKLPQITLDNTRPGSGKISCDRASNERNSYGIYSHVGFESQNGNDRAFRAALENTSSFLKKIPSGERPFNDRKNTSSNLKKIPSGEQPFNDRENTSVMIQRGNETFSQIALNKEGSKIEKFPCNNESSDQHEASTSTTYSPTSVETQWGIEGTPRIITNNQSSKTNEQKESLRTEKGDEGETQCYPHLDLTLEKFKARQLLRAQVRESQQNSFKGQKIIQKLPQITLDNTRPESGKISCDRASNERNSCGIYSQTVFESQNGNERSFQIALENAMANAAQQLPICESPGKFNFTSCFTHNVQTQTAKRSSGAHNRTCPVILKTSVAAKKDLRSDNFTVPHETTAQQTVSYSRSYSRTNVQGQKKTERLSEVALDIKSQSIEKIANDETSTRQNISDSAKYGQPSVASQKGIQGFPQVALDNKRPKSEEILCHKAADEKNSYGIYPQTSYENQKDNERSFQIALENAMADEAQQLPICESPGKFNFTSYFTHNVQTQTAKRSASAHNRTCSVILKTSVAAKNDLRGDNFTVPHETTAQQTVSNFRSYSRTNVQVQKKTERLSEVDLDIKSQSIEKIANDETSTRQNISDSAKYGQRSVASRKAIQGFPQVALDDKRPKSEEILCHKAADEKNSYGIYPQTSYESQKDNERSFQIALENASSSLKKSSCTKETG